MHSARPTRIAIVGAGASGSLLAVQLCRLPQVVPLHITLFEKHLIPGPGLAYSTTEPLHLLNVPAQRMSAFPDEPDHFLNWLQKHNHPFGPYDFVPRGLLGKYLSELVNQVISEPPAHVTIQFVQDEVKEVVLQNGEVELSTAIGAAYTAQKVVLALGNFPPAHPCQALSLLGNSAPYAANPWLPGLFTNLKQEETVLLVGTGLTMVDVVMSLHYRGHTGAIVAVSTHGHLPNPHQLSAPYTGVSEEVAQVACVKEWLSYIRNHIKLAARQGIDWRAVIDAFRPYSQAFWLQLSQAEKVRFMRHLRHIWAISRHRMPPKSAEIVHQMLHTGQLKLKRGRVTEAKVKNGQILATLRNEQSQQHEVITASLVVNCTGPESDIRKVPSVLVGNLLAQGLVAPDALYTGFAATAGGELLTAQDQLSGKFFSLGPPLKGVLWESTAIPEIRQQAHQLARLLVQHEVEAFGLANPAETA